MESNGRSADEKQSFLQLADVHRGVDKLFLQHPESLLACNRDGAVERLGGFASGVRAHVRTEKKALRSAYGERAGQGEKGSVALFLAEHRKIEQLLDALAEAVRALPEHRDARPRPTIALLDRESSFKHLMEHHDLRERRFLYPILDRVTTPDERREMARRMEEWVSG